MPDPTQDANQIQGLPEGATLKPIQAAPTNQIEGLPQGATLKPIAAAPAQPPVTNSAGETMPADVAARHSQMAAQKQAEGVDFGHQSTGVAEHLEDVGTGFAKEAAKTVLGASKLIPGADLTQVMQPDTETKGIGEGIGGLGEGMLEYATGEELLKGVSRIAKLEKLAQNSPTVAKILRESPDFIKKIVHGGAKAATIGAAQGAVKGAADDKAGEGAVAGGVGGAIGGGAGEAVGQLAKPVARILGIGGLSGEEAMTKAGRPYIGEHQWKQSLETAAPRIVEAAKDKSFKNVGEFVDLLHDTAQNIRQKEFQPMIDRHGKDIVDATSIASNITSAVTDQMKEYAPEEAKEITDFAAKFNKNMPLAKAEQDLQYFNKQLSKYYKMAAGDKNGALKTDGTIAKYEAAADGLRDVIYNHLKQKGEAIPEELQKQYGSLKTLERVFEKRARVADRQAPLNLPQIISLATGGGEAATALMMGHPLAAVAGAVPMAITTAQKMRQAPESLIKQGVKALADEAAPKGESVVAKGAKKLAGAAGAEAGQWIDFTASDGKKYKAHPEDWEKVQQADPGAKQVQP